MGVVTPPFQYSTIPFHRIQTPARYGHWSDFSSTTSLSFSKLPNQQEPTPWTSLAGSAPSREGADPARLPLGHGSYGAVYKAKCDQLPCAAKVLHPTILDPMDPRADKIMDRFRQEFALLENIRHPNIVQYLAMTLDPESRLPVLLMELLDESLTKMLERSPQSLAYYIQVDICHDVALAIAYLHSNNIIHRDLSSNNVLIIAG